MKKINLIFNSLMLFCMIFLTSCNDNDDTQLPRGNYENGILVSGEGSGAGTGSVFFIDNDYTTTENTIFRTVNNRDLGTFLQSIAFDNSKAYIVVDNQNTITVVDRFTFEEIGQITNQLMTPRYMTVVGNRGYITNWGNPSDETDDFIAVVDSNTFEFIEKIAVGNGPERIVENNGKLYVSHKGAFSTNNIVSVIDIASKNIGTINVKDNPDEMYINNNQLIVLSEGRTLFDSSFNVIGHTLAGIATINLSDNLIISEIVFDNGQHPSLMVVNANQIYYALGNDVFRVDLSATAQASSALLKGADSFLYGMEVTNNNIFTLDASFTDISKLNIFDASNNNLTNTLDAPIGAAKIYFN